MSDIVASWLNIFPGEYGPVAVAVILYTLHCLKCTLLKCRLYVSAYFNTSRLSYTNVKWNSVCWERKEKSEEPTTAELKPRVSD